LRWLTFSARRLVAPPCGPSPEDSEMDALGVAAGGDGGAGRRGAAIDVLAPASLKPTRVVYEQAAVSSPEDSEMEDASGAAAGGALPAAEQQLACAPHLRSSCFIYAGCASGAPAGGGGGAVAAAEQALPLTELSPSEAELRDESMICPICLVRDYLLTLLDFGVSEPYKPTVALRGRASGRKHDLPHLPGAYHFATICKAASHSRRSTNHSVEGACGEACDLWTSHD